MQPWLIPMLYVIGAVAGGLALPRIEYAWQADTAIQADTPRPADTRIARRVHRTGSRPGTARPRPSPGQGVGRIPRLIPGPSHGRIPELIPGPSHGRIPGLSPGPSLDRGLSRSRRPPRRPGGAPGGGTGCPSRSLPNSSAWPRSRTRRTRSMRRCRAPCAWSRRTAASRCSAVPTTPGWMCASSKTRKRPTFTCLASWPPKPSAAGAYALGRLTGASTDPAGLGCLRPPRKTFRSTYGAGN